jgi:DNA-binding transcriptional LysR family regulator
MTTQQRPKSNPDPTDRCLNMATLKDLEVFIALADLMGDDQTKSIADYNEEMGFGKGKLDKVLRRLRACFGEPLVMSGEGAGKTLSDAGRNLHASAREHVLGGLQKLSCKQHRLTVHASAALQCELLPLVTTKFMQDPRWRGKVRYSFPKLSTRDIKAQLKEGKADLGLGWNPLGERSSYIEEVGPDFHMGLITPPGHPLASGRPEELSVRQAVRSGSPLYTIQPECMPAPAQSALKACPEGQMVPVADYGAVLSHVRHSAGVGVGVVPLWYWKLERLREHTGLFYCRLAGCPTHRLVAYMPNNTNPRESVRDRLPAVARAYLDLFEKTLYQLAGALPS